MSNNNDKYELLCKSTDDDSVLNKNKIMIPIKGKKDYYNISSNNSILTNKILKFILIFIGSTLSVILISIFLIKQIKNYIKKNK